MTERNLSLQALRALLALVAGRAGHHPAGHRLRGPRQLQSARLRPGSVDSYHGRLAAGGPVDLRHLLAFHHRRMAAVHPQLRPVGRGDPALTATAPFSAARIPTGWCPSASTTRCSAWPTLGLKLAIKSADLGERNRLPVLCGMARSRPRLARSAGSRHRPHARRFHDAGFPHRHVYLTTTGHTPLATSKAMITGYEETH